MEYCSHGDLNSFLEKRGCMHLSETKVWKFFIEITLGLDCLHSEGILHRDLKTLNIFLTKDNSAWIGDLGVAKIVEQGGFVSKKVGTPYYLSPEVCQDKPYDGKSDIWSLGIILYEIASLRHPFEAENQAELMIKIVKGRYKRIPQSYSKELSSMIHWWIKKDPNMRPTTKDIILNPTFQHWSIKLRIQVPYHPKDIVVPGEGGVSLSFQALKPSSIKKTFTKAVTSHYKKFFRGKRFQRRETEEILETSPREKLTDSQSGTVDEQPYDGSSSKRIPNQKSSK